jgi:hypothetical protein
LRHNLLLAGGAIFGLVDHLWNGELLLLGENLFLDLMLGVAITAAIFIVWIVFVSLDKTQIQKPVKVLK